MTADRGSGDRTATVRSQQGEYPIFSGAGLLDALPALMSEHAPAHRYAIIADSRVWGLYGVRITESLAAAGVRYEPLIFPAGEASKSVAEWLRLSERMVEAGLGRDSAVVGIGGGVTTDLAGFVAATFMRGVPVLQVPTSVLAMADAAVGGKTGVNLAAGKNLVGAFHAPRCVLVDPTLIQTQTPSQRIDGWVEAVKHGAVLDATHLTEIRACGASLARGEVDAATAVLTRTIQLKARVVSEDEREHGLRELLNFGHTLGHAIEAASNWRISHGRAVALGMLAECRAAEMDGHTPVGTADQIADVLDALGADTTLRGVDPDKILLATVGDKKSRQGDARYVILAEPGRARAGGLVGLTEPSLRSALAGLS